MSRLGPPGRPPPPDPGGRPGDPGGDELPAELEALAALVARLGSSDLADPAAGAPLPPGLEEAVVARVRSERVAATRARGELHAGDDGDDGDAAVAGRGARASGPHDARAVRARRRPWPALGALAAAAAVAVVVGGVVVAGGDGDGGAVEPVAFTEAPPGADASFTLRARPWGTEIELEVAGLEPGAHYWLWLTDESGRRSSAGTFSGPSGGASLTFTSGVPAGSARRVWVTDASDAVVLDAEVPR